MGWYIPRFLQFPGYETRDVKENHKTSKLCEISAVTNAADYNDVEAMTAWRIDFKRMQLMLRYYKIPKVNSHCFAPLGQSIKIAWSFLIFFSI